MTGTQEITMVQDLTKSLHFSMIMDPKRYDWISQIDSTINNIYEQIEIISKEPKWSEATKQAESLKLEIMLLIDTYSKFKQAIDNKLKEDEFMNLVLKELELRKKEPNFVPGNTAFYIKENNYHTMLKADVDTDKISNIEILGRTLAKNPNAKSNNRIKFILGIAVAVAAAVAVVAVAATAAGLLAPLTVPIVLGAIALRAVCVFSVNKYFAAKYANNRKTDTDKKQSEVSLWLSFSERLAEIQSKINALQKCLKEVTKLDKPELHPDIEDVEDVEYDWHATDAVLDGSSTNNLQIVPYVENKFKNAPSLLDTIVQSKTRPDLALPLAAQIILGRPKI